MTILVGRIGDEAPLAVAALLGRALLIVDQHGDTVDLAQRLLRLDDALPVPHVDTVGQIDALVLAPVVGGDDGAPHTFAAQPVGEVRDGHRPGRILAAGHGHRAVVEDLERDV